MGNEWQCLIDSGKRREGEEGGEEADKLFAMISFGRWANLNFECGQAAVFWDCWAVACRLPWGAHRLQLGKPNSLLV